VEFANKVAVITGGAGRIGAPTAVRLARAGAHVVIIDRAFAEARVVAQAITDSGDSAEAIEADLTSPTRVSAVVDELASRLGQVDILVNNLGASLISAPALSISDEAWLQVFNVNLFAAVRLDRGIIPLMLKQGVGNL
jgi:NAD(P)-dependent dehydrogenase (short-subunit alcohol dehydrogenase family)